MSQMMRKAQSILRFMEVSLIAGFEERACIRLPCFAGQFTGTEELWQGHDKGKKDGEKRKWNAFPRPASFEGEAPQTVLYIVVAALDEACIARAGRAFTTSVTPWLCRYSITS